MNRLAKRHARYGYLLLAALFFTSTPPAHAQTPDDKTPGPVYILGLDNQIISPVTKEYLFNGIELAEQNAATCLIIEMDTPGGLLESTREIVKRILNAKVPIVVYVAPSGSRAGSAGVFITLASHVAVMAPGTNIGAAHPVSVGGDKNALRADLLPEFLKRFFGPNGPDTEDTNDQDPNSEDSESGAAETSPMEDKILNDTLAWITSIAEQRGRNAEWARKAVKESVSATADEALELGIIDFIAADHAELIRRLNGREIVLGNETRTLQTTGAVQTRIEMSTRQKLLAHITNPNIAYILMMLGTFGLIFEFTHPGIGFPGIAGLICLLTAFYAFQTLPVNLVAIALVVFGVVLLVAEAMIVSQGLLAFGALIALTLGSLMLFDSPDPSMRVSLHVIWPTIATIGILFFLLLRALFRTRLNRVATGYEGLVGEEARATTDINPAGKVFLHGEYWNAVSDSPITKDTPVRVVAVSGLKVTVEPLSKPTA